MQNRPQKTSIPNLPPGQAARHAEQKNNRGRPKNNNTLGDRGAPRYITGLANQLPDAPPIGNDRGIGIRTSPTVKLHLANTAGLNIFTAYGDDYVAVNHEKFQENLIVLPELLMPAWSASSVETLTEADMQVLMGLGTEIVLLGTGKRLRFPAGPLMRPFAPAGIGLEIMDLQAACRTYNILAAEGRKVAAALLFDRT